jgi:hypothetical protein
MTTLKLTMMLGPVERIEAAELAMPDMAGCLFAADALEGWDATEAEAPLLSLRAEVARALAPEAWAAADASLRQADEVMAVIEKRRAA